MTALPAAADFTGSSITEAQFKTAMTTLRSYLSGILGDAGTVAAAQATIKAMFGAGVDAKTGAYTVAAADRGKLLTCSGTWTLSLLAAATAGAGFAVAVRNTGSGTITIDPNGSEEIDGEETIAVSAGSSALIVCTGSVWLTVGDGGGIDDDYIEGRHVKKLSSFPALTVTASDTTIVDNSHDETVGTLTTNSVEYQVAYTKVVSDLYTGSMRYKFSHKSSLSGKTSYLQVKKNGVVVGGPWTTTSTIFVERVVDITVAPGDIITFEHHTNYSLEQSIASNGVVTASDSYKAFVIYGKNSEK